MKVCVSDVDGIIVDNLGNLSKYTIDTLIDFQNRGNLIVLASGRSYLRMTPIAKQLKMDNFDGYLIQRLISEISEIKHEVNKISICHEYDTLVVIQNKFKKSKFSKNFDIQFSGIRRIDIISKNISKGKVLKKILNELKIEENEIYIFGDSENDISMLELSENSYIMENSKIDNYNNQFYIAPSNNNDGVAKIINTLLQV